MKGSPAAPPTSYASSSCPVISRTLSLGSRGADVTALQTFFRKVYKEFPAPTGYFGPVTQATLKQWQREHGITTTGGTGPKTRAALAVCGR